MNTRTILSCSELQRLYVDERLGVAAVAQICGTSPATISNWLRRCGIPARSGRFTARQIPADHLHQLYVVEQLPIRRIAEIFGVSVGTVNNRRRAYGLPGRGRRPPSSHHRDSGATAAVAAVAEKDKNSLHFPEDLSGSCS